MVFATMLFMAVLYLSIYLWNTTIDKSRVSENEYQMNFLVESVSNQLINTPGVPHDWEPKSVQVYGLADSSNQTRKWKGTGYQSRVIDIDKVLYLIHQLDYNYSLVRRKLLGGGKYDVGFRLSCKNQSRLDCLQGLSVRTIEVDIPCENGYSFTVTEKRLDRHEWIEAEAEDYWGNPGTDNCGDDNLACSNKLNSHVSEGDGVKTVRLDPGLYNIWVRSYDDDTATELVVDGTAYQISQELNTGMRWNKIGQANLEGSVTLEIDNTVGYYLDAILFTTDPDLEPNNVPGSFGNPNLVGECLFGAVTDADKVVASSRTGVFSRPLSDIEAMGADTIEFGKAFRLDTYIIMNPEVQLPPGPTSTSTIEAMSITCNDVTGSSPNCDISGDSVIDFNGVGFPSYFECGVNEVIDVNWRGKHNGHNNYFAFHAINETDEAVKLGVCTTLYDTDDEVREFVMQCNAQPPAAGGPLRDKPYEVYLTGENNQGYCEPGDMDADAAKGQQIEFRNCYPYEDLSCTDNPSASHVQCGNPTDLIDLVRAEMDDIQFCGQDFDVNIFWNGSHYPDAVRRNYFSFFRDGDYNNPVKICHTEKAGDDGQNNFYKTTCTLNLDFAESDHHLLEVTGEDSQGACNDVGQADLYHSFGQILFTSCPNGLRSDPDGDGFHDTSNCNNCNGCTCSVDADHNTAEGLCVGTDCIQSPGEVSIDCYDDCINDQNQDMRRGALGYCSRLNGWPCDNDYIQGGQNFFEMDGKCAEVDGNPSCVTPAISEHICNRGGVYYDSCLNDCQDGDPCQPTASKNRFDSFKYECQSGSCVDASPAAAFDWRNHQGANYMTPVKDQGVGCNACFAFAEVGVMEAKYKIQENAPGITVDLSEQNMVADCCQYYATSCGDCSGSFTPATGLFYAMKTGINDETCYPYQEADSTCSDDLSSGKRCVTYQNNLWKVTQVGPSLNTASVNDLKNAIKTHGPITARMSIGDPTWVGDVMECNTLTGSHEVIIVGWDDIENYWIVKNSWGVDWPQPGEGGYFKLRYGECGLQGVRYVLGVQKP